MKREAQRVLVHPPPLPASSYEYPPTESMSNVADPDRTKRPIPDPTVDPDPDLDADPDPSPGPNPDLSPDPDLDPGPNSLFRRRAVEWRPPTPISLTLSEVSPPRPRRRWELGG